MEDDAISGGDELSLSEAVTAFTQTEAPEEVQEDQTDDVEVDESELADDDELQASDEEAGDEVDGEDSEDDQAEGDDEDDGEPESEQGRFVADNARVKLADGTIVSVEDLKKGSLLHADYTRKTQETAEQRRALEAQSESVTKAEQQLTEQREYMTALLQSVTPQAPDPAMLRTDPITYWEMEAAHKQFTEHLNYIASQTQETQTKRQQETQTERQAKLNTEWGSLLEKAPELKDKSKFTAFEADLNTIGPEYGFTPQELLETVPYDHRMALVLKDAMAMRKLRASKPKAEKKSEGRPPIHKGGKRLNPSAQKARQRDEALTRLNSSGSVKDGIAALLAIEQG